jgi:hypothetical protein
MCETYYEHQGIAVALLPDQASAEACSPAKIELWLRCLVPAFGGSDRG